MPSILNATTSSGLVTSADNSGSLQLATNNGTTAVTIDTSQNVGIGITTPQQTLHVNNASSPRIKLTNSTTGTGSTDGSEISIFDADTSLRIINRESANILFGTSDTERMRITSGGNLLINTTTQFTTGGFSPRVTLNAPADGFAIPSIGNGYIGYLIQASGSHNYYPAYFLNSGNNGIGNIQCSTTSTSFNTSSDYRLKDEITPMTGALAKVSALKPVTYKWKIDGSDGQGFIAHELAEVVPDAVSGEKDATEMVDIKDEDGKVIGQETKPVYQGIDTSFLVATLTAAIQELNAKVDAQALEIQALKGVA